MLEKDTWFNAEQALKAGFVSGVLENTHETEALFSNPKEIYGHFKPLFNGHFVSSLNITNNSKTKNMDNKQENHREQEFKDNLNALQTELEAQKEKNRKLQEQLDELRQTEINDTLKKARLSGKINDKTEAVFREIAQNNGVNSLKIVLGTIPDRVSLSAQINGKLENDQRLWNYKEWQLNDPKGLEKRAKEDPQWFEELLKAQN